MRNLNLKRLRILSEVTQTINGVAKISSQAVDVEARLIPEALPAFQCHGWPQSAKSRHFAAHNSGFRLSQIWGSAEMQVEQVWCSRHSVVEAASLLNSVHLSLDFKTLPALTAL